MIYCKEQDRLELPLDELVSLSLLRYASEVANEWSADQLVLPDARHVPGIGEPCDLSHAFSYGAHRFLLYGRADGLLPGDSRQPPCLTLVRGVQADPGAPDRDTLRRARGLLFGLCFLYFSAHREVGQLRACLHLYHIRNGSTAVREETVSRTAAGAFFARLCDCLGSQAADVVDRVAHRLPTLDRLPFPYRNRRAAQDEMIQAAYRTVKHGGRLYVCAPTGTGKTAAALYPTLRAMGAGYCEKIFYLTPKTTTAHAAATALGRFAAAGGRLRAISLLAKERLCREKLACRDLPSPCRRAAAGTREEEACAALLKSTAVPVGEEELHRTADAYGVCPYELALRYSQFCDVVIADYNYLFDTRVYLRRYFEQGGPWCFLIDEAHDLVERAREMYSGVLSDAALSSLCDLCRENTPLSLLCRQAEALRVQFLRGVKSALHGERQYEDAAGAVHRFAASHVAPDLLIDAAATLAEEGLRLCGDRRLPLSLRKLLREALYPLRDFATRAALYGRGFETFFEQAGENYTLRTVCLDPAAILDRRLSLGKSAILFSATLTPLSYYRTVLGGDAQSGELLLPSPFEEENLCVAVMDQISTRYATRSESAPAIAAAIHAMVSAQQGNYFVFCPSFAYMEELARAYHSRHPQVRLRLQKRGATLQEREAFLSAFVAQPKETLVGFCVTGGVFAEGIDLAGSRLIGAAVVGVGIPQPSEEREAMCAYYDEIYEQGKAYAYFYPGMNRVLQAAGRVIRTEEDRGTLLLIDDRFADPLYRALIPSHWRHLKYVGDAAACAALFRRFWQKGPLQEV